MSYINSTAGTAFLSFYMIQNVVEPQYNEQSPNLEITENISHIFNLKLFFCASLIKTRLYVVKLNICITTASCSS